MMQAHRAPPCPGCATCRQPTRRDRVIAKLVIVLFVAMFVIPAVFRMVHG